jgi:hypothetical protein
MMTHAAVNAERHVTYAIWRKTMSEPRLEDDIATGQADECEDCGNFIHTCECDSGEPDRMYGDQN